MASMIPDKLWESLTLLLALNTSAKADVTRTREDRLAESGRADANRHYEAEHPVVRTHPETGEPCLFVNSVFTQRIKGLRGEESRALMAFLNAHVQKPEFVVRWRWTPWSACTLRERACRCARWSWWRATRRASTRTRPAMANRARSPKVFMTACQPHVQLRSMTAAWTAPRCAKWRCKTRSAPITSARNLRAGPT